VVDRAMRARRCGRASVVGRERGGDPPRRRGARRAARRHRRWSAKACPVQAQGAPAHPGAAEPGRPRVPVRLHRRRRQPRGAVPVHGGGWGPGRGRLGVLRPPARAAGRDARRQRPQPRPGPRPVESRLRGAAHLVAHVSQIQALRPRLRRRRQRVQGGSGVCACQLRSLSLISPHPPPHRLSKTGGAR